MTKTEARAWLKRTREGLRDAEQALRANDGQALREAMTEVTGSAAEVQSATESGELL